MRALLTTVEAGSLSAAAKRLGLTQPTLGRQVAALEESLGLAIFERVGRNLVLTAHRYPDTHFFGLDVSTEMLTSAIEQVGRAGSGADELHRPGIVVHRP